MKTVRIAVDAAQAEALEAYFCEDYQTQWGLEQDVRTGAQTLCGYFADAGQQAAALAALRADFPALASAQLKEGELADCDWKEAYKLHFKPWSERGLHWVPVWERANYTLPEGEQIVYLDPGMAFGTGNHETTRLCVRRILDIREQLGLEACGRSRLMDAGCGSGILAISARKMGFGHCAGFDNDPEAVRISVENAALCEVTGQVAFRWAGLEDGFEAGPYDVVVANIIANVLIAQRDALITAVARGGWLVLSGILAAEVEGVHADFAERIAALRGVQLPMDARIEGEWADLCYQFVS